MTTWGWEEWHAKTSTTTEAQVPLSVPERNFFSVVDTSRGEDARQLLVFLLSSNGDLDTPSHLAALIGKHSFTQNSKARRRVFLRTSKTK
jgi:hypothetical protein